MKDSDIIDRIKKADEGALKYLYQKYYRMMVRMIINNSGTEEEAQDIFQDSLIIFWEKVINNELQLTSKISTYLYSICQNLWRKELDRKKRLSREEKDGEIPPEHDQNEIIKIMHACINELGETCKQVLTLYYFDKLSMKEIADKLSFSNADTAKTKKYKCKQELDKLVKSKYTIEDFVD